MEDAIQVKKVADASKKKFKEFTNRLSITVDSAISIFHFHKFMT